MEKGGFVSGNRSIKVGGLTLTTGNSKMGRVLNISLPPPQTCDTSLPCYKSGCYAMRTAYGLYPEVRAAWNGNLQVWMRSRDRYIDAVDAAIDKAKPDLFRWHVGGDIPGWLSDAHAYIVDAICGIAKRHPDVRFWSTTKKHFLVSLHRRAIAACPNLTVMLSMWPGLEADGRLLRHWPTAWVNDPKNPDPRIPKDARPCSGRCDTCAACWGMKAGESVVFKKH